MKTGLPILLLLIMNAATRAPALDLQADLLQAIANKNYVQPGRADLARARELFKLTLDAERVAPAELAASWAALGFEFREVERSDEMFWLVRDPGQTGRGWYLFRKNRELKAALEAPHARNDINTGLIAFRLFCEGKARVLAAATITRHRADMGHLENTFFQAFTLAFSEACPGGLVAQVHGFDAENHAGAKADIVVSAGTGFSQPWFEQFVRDLGDATSLRVLAYPRDTRQLGATLNVQGRALRKSGQCRFLHLEISAPVRERLTRDNKLCGQVIESLTRSTTP
jgi:hypothetical protein